MDNVSAIELMVKQLANWFDRSNKRKKEWYALIETGSSTYKNWIEGCLSYAFPSISFIAQEEQQKPLTRLPDLVIHHEISTVRIQQLEQQYPFAVHKTWSKLLGYGGDDNLASLIALFWSLPKPSARLQRWLGRGSSSQASQGGPLQIQLLREGDSSSIGVSVSILQHFAQEFIRDVGEKHQISLTANSVIAIPAAIRKDDLLERWCHPAFFQYLSTLGADKSNGFAEEFPPLLLNQGYLFQFGIENLVMNITQFVFTDRAKINLEFQRVYWACKNDAHAQKEERQARSIGDIVLPWSAAGWIQYCRRRFIMSAASLALLPPGRDCPLKPWEAGDGKSLTLVTALFSIRKREYENSTHGQLPKSVKSAREYLELSKPLMAWPCNLVIFCEPEVVDDVFTMRAAHVLQHKTMVIPMTMEQSMMWSSCTDRILELYANNIIPSRFCKFKDTGLYVFSQATKYDCLHRVLRLNPWKTSSLFWIDLGIHHVATPPVDVIHYLRELNACKRIRQTHLRWLDLQEIANKKSFFSQLQQSVGGGLIGGPVRYVRWLVDHFEREFIAALSYFPVLDEAILGCLALMYPCSVLPIHSGHKEMLEVRKIPITIQTAMSLFHQYQDIDRAYDLCCELPPLNEHEQDVLEAIQLLAVVLQIIIKTTDHRKDCVEWLKSQLLLREKHWPNLLVRKLQILVKAARDALK